MLYSPYRWYLTLVPGSLYHSLTMCIDHVHSYRCSHQCLHPQWPRSCGLGRHIFYLQADQTSDTLYLVAILQPIRTFSFTVLELAVVMLIGNLMGPKKRGISFLYSIVTILAIATTLSAIFSFAQCDLPSHVWNPTKPAKCWSPNVLKYTTIFQGCEFFASKSLRK